MITDWTPSAYDAVHRVLFELLGQWCERMHVPPGRVLQASAYRTEPLTMCRAHLVADLQRRVFQCYAKRKLEIYVCETLDEPTPKCPPWEPLSTPLIGALLGMDHSAVVQLKRKLLTGRTNGVLTPTPEALQTVG